MRKLIALTALVVILVGACGGDDDNTSENAPAQSDTTVQESSSGDFSDFCGARAAFAAGGNTGAAPSVDALKNSAANIDKAVSYAPPEIKSDVRVVIDASKPLVELLASVNYDYTKLMSDQSKAQELQTVSAKLQEPNVQEASQRVNAWVTAHCK